MSSDHTPFQRLYTSTLLGHFAKHRQMMLVQGPRQVGKSTVGEEVLRHHGAGLFLNWDLPADRALIVSGPEAVAEAAGASKLADIRPLIVLDELHKYVGWRDFLKGLFDGYWRQCHILVTGSAKLGLFNRGGDSLSGRYFQLNMHPLSVGELLHRSAIEAPLASPPQPMTGDDWAALLTFGGFPEPYFSRDLAFWRSWQKVRFQAAFEEEIRDITFVRKMAQIDLLASLLVSQSGQVANYDGLGKKIQVSSPTVREWVELLRAVYFGFELRPWSNNIERSLLKQPKWYAADWSLVEDPGFRFESLVAAHLKKSVDYWNDTGVGDFGLHYIRDKQGREVDFLVSRDQEPWLLVEAKLSDTSLTPELLHFQGVLKPEYAVQVVQEMPFQSLPIQAARGRCVAMSAQSFLSQLV
ncbi:MAG: ATP-binding protein [Chlamydiia bacterium]